MNTLMIREFGDFRIPDSNCFDLTKTNIADCIGCWTCWWKTPGICIHEDLADFYRSYINADKVIIFAKLENGFVSSKLKTLLDRMIPLFLPSRRSTTIKVSQRLDRKPKKLVLTALLA